MHWRNFSCNASRRLFANFYLKYHWHTRQCANTANKSYIPTLNTATLRTRRLFSTLVRSIWRVRSAGYRTPDWIGTLQSDVLSLSLARSVCLSVWPSGYGRTLYDFLHQDSGRSMFNSQVGHGQPSHGLGITGLLVQRVTELRRGRAGGPNSSCSNGFE